jgi:hypothetical protein
LRYEVFKAKGRLLTTRESHVKVPNNLICRNIARREK